MANKSKREQPSSIVEAIIVAAVVIAGLALQLLLGQFDSRALQFPLNLLLGGLLLTPLFLKKGAIFRRASSTLLSIYLIALLGIFSLLMGLIPNNGIKNSWPFVLLYLLLLVNLSFVISNRLKRFSLSLKEIAFFLNHAGLLLLLFAMGPGGADKSRYFMTVREGEVEWRGRVAYSGNSNKEAVELPVAIELINFSMEEYPPKLVVLDVESGKVSPLDAPLISTRWQIAIDSTVEHYASAPISYITVRDLKRDSTFHDHLTCGNYFQHFRAVQLEPPLSVVMSPPEPKRYSSTVNIYERGGESKSGVVEVNRPMAIKGWRIYQYSYDTVRGRASQYSVFELVYDRWSTLSYIGIIMLLLGALTLFWKGVTE
ncbi:MAG: cytochrome c biogenesis protein ResB [Bacteroidales bacterium]